MPRNYSFILACSIYKSDRSFRDKKDGHGASITDFIIGWLVCTTISNFELS